MLVRSGSGLCMQIYRSTLIPFHIDSMFGFRSCSGGLVNHGNPWVMVNGLPCP